MAFKLGKDCVLNYKVGGGAWTALTNVRDVSLGLSKDEADVTVRANAGWKATAATLKDASIDFEMIYDTADAGFTAMKDSYLNDTVIGIQVLDGTGGHGLQADMTVFKLDLKQTNNEAVTVSVSIKPTYSSTAPTWI